MFVLNTVRSRRDLVRTFGVSELVLAVVVRRGSLGIPRLPWIDAERASAKLAKLDTHPHR